MGRPALAPSGAVDAPAPPSLARRWAKLAVPLTLLRASGQALELLAWAVMARRLGPASFGAVSVAFLVARWGGVVADWGASARGARDVAAGAHDDVDALLRTRATVAWLAAAAFVAGCAVTGRAELLPLAAVVLNGGLVRDWIAVGNGRAVTASAPTLVRGVALVALALAVTTSGGAALAIAAAYASAALLSRLLNPRPRGLRAASRGSFVAPWAAALVVGTQIYTTADTVLLGALRSSREAGVYNAVYRWPMAATTVVALVVGGLLPALTAELRSGQLSFVDARRRLNRLGLGAGLAILLVTPAVVAVGPALFGPAYAEGRTALALLLVATAVSTTSGPLSALWIADGRERVLCGVVAAGAVVNVIGNLLLLHRFGMVAAAGTTVASEVLVWALMWLGLGRRMR